MAYFPFMIEIEDKKCLVVGGGKIALHKIKILIKFGVNICVIAKDICTELNKMSEEESRIVIIQKQFADSDIDGVDIVVAATDDVELNSHISELCKRRNIPINAVDMKEISSFIFPAMIQEQDLTIAVSTGGQSPAAAAYVKRKIQKQLPDYYGDMIVTLGKYRETVLKNVDTAQKRKIVFQKLLEYADAHNGEIPEDEVSKAIDEVLIHSVNCSQSELLTE
jgi:siroheme synthase-like protein